MLNDLVLVHLNLSGHDRRKQLQIFACLAQFKFTLPCFCIHLWRFTLTTVRTFVPFQFWLSGLFPLLLLVFFIKLVIFL